MQIVWFIHKNFDAKLAKRKPLSFLFPDAAHSDIDCLS